MMMHYWETVHTEERDGFEIILAFSPEDSEPDWDMTPEEKTEIMESIKNGDLLWFIARMEVKKAGATLGADYLGGCCYASAQDFIGGGCYEDMITEAMREAMQTIEAINA